MSRVPGRPSGGRVGVTTALVTMAVLVGGMWVLEAADQVSGNELDPYGIRPLSDEGLVSIAFAPWLHGGWANLAGNSVPFFVLGTLALLDGWRTWLWATAVIVVTSGLAVWLFSAPGSITLGASGVVFGWLTYLLVRGLYSGSLAQIAVGIVVFLVYGSILWGVVPGDVGISWQGHLGGAVGGVLAARWLHRQPSRPAAPTYAR